MPRAEASRAAASRGVTSSPRGRAPREHLAGRFPTSNSRDDVRGAAAPVTAFSPNGFATGRRERLGMVRGLLVDAAGAGLVVDPRGPAPGSERVMRGGSYLCHDSYCNRYRVAARTKNTPDSSAGNIGFTRGRRCGAEDPRHHPRTPSLIATTPSASFIRHHLQNAEFHRHHPEHG